MNLTTKKTLNRNHGKLPIFIVCGFVAIMVLFHRELKKAVDDFDNSTGTVETKHEASTSDMNMATTTSTSASTISSTTYDPKRLCTQNQYVKSLNLPLSEYGSLVDTWLDNKIEIEKNLTLKTNGNPHNHDRFDAFEVMGGCNTTCVGGPCRRDTSKITCGVAEGDMEAPCVVYSVGGNNQWEFEMDVLAKTPCEVHTFDCTGPITRFTKPEHERLHFHHVCLGQKNKPAPAEPASESKSAVHGEFWTLEKMQKTLKHSQIDLFKIDIEGYEFPMLDFWPDLTDMNAPTAVLPMQVLVEVHYQTHMTELSGHPRIDWKFSTDLINLQTHLLKMGYIVANRDNNNRCKHCSELTLVRIRCPETPELTV
jgi:hypothetical protein